ncbi:hypothetical protein GIB67_022482 [Kingdonia uniflora]|uniref:RRM domain-containing protein n=1 Tax=Kingdonia uniflora TaxID=39325 RepID=A0A7J7KZS4_9MAGN|nr:hypothetical protein GIB67_022482 [Kingdonia uniflora]
MTDSPSVLIRHLQLRLIPPIRLAAAAAAAAAVAAGLSFYTSQKTLRAAFEGFGELVEVKIIMDKISKRSKGYAFLEYTTEEAVGAALKEMNDKNFIKTLGITFSVMSMIPGTPLYGSSLLYAGPATLVWGFVVVSSFTWFVGIARAEICSSFPTTGSLYFWAAHLAGPKWGPLASWCCAWLETINLIAGMGAQAYSASQMMQDKDGGYFAPG